MRLYYIIGKRNKVKMRNIKFRGFSKNLTNNKWVYGDLVNYSETEKIINDAISQNNIAVPFFYLQGGLNLKKLKGIYKFMINTLSKTVVKKYENSPKKTPEEELMLEMFKNGKDMVKEENLKPIIQWFKK